MSWKRFVTVLYLKWVLWILIAARWGMIVVEASGGDTFSWKLAVLETGELAWYLLIFTIFISLLHKVFSQFWLWRNLLPLRKYTGIFAFLVVGSHALFEFLKRGIATDISAMMKTAFSTQYAMIFGTVAFLVMLPLFLTSTEWAVGRMGYGAWKNLQRLTHIVFIAAALHIGLLRYFYNGSIEWGPFILLAVYATGYGYLWMWRRKSGATDAS